MPGLRDIKVRFSGDASGLQKAAAQSESSVSRFSDRTQKVAKVALAGVGAFVGGLALALKGGVEGIQEGEEAESKFADALSRSSPKIRAQADALKANAEQVQKNTRFTYEAALGASTFLAAQDGLKRAVGAGVVSMKDATNVSLDLATVMGVDATTAAGVLSKALAAPEKATGALRKAGVTLTAGEQAKVKALVKSGKVADAQALIMDKLKTKTEGAATAAGQTTAGQLERAKNAFGEVQESLATALLPTLTNLLQKFVAVTAWAQDNPGKIKVIVGVLGALAAVIGTVSLAITVWSAITRTAAAIQAVWNAVMAANPIVLITLAILALIAVVVVIATKTDWFQRLWKNAWGAIQGAVSGAFNWIKSNWPLILAILTGPIGLAVLAITKNKDRIIGVIGAIPEAAKRLFSGLGDVLAAPLKWAIEAVRSAWNNTVGGKGWDKVSIPFAPDLPGFRIPMLAQGGTARAGMAHIVGEAGPELFVPGRTGTVVPNHDLGGDQTLNLTLDLGEGIQKVFEIKLDRRNRATKTAALAGSRRAFA